MYYYGGGSCGCGGSMPYYPTYGYGYYGQSNSNYAIHFSIIYSISYRYRC